MTLSSRQIGSLFGIVQNNCHPAAHPAPLLVWRVLPIRNLKRKPLCLNVNVFIWLLVGFRSRLSLQINLQTPLKCNFKRLLVIVLRDGRWICTGLAVEIVNLRLEEKTFLSKGLRRDFLRTKTALNMIRLVVSRPVLISYVRVQKVSFPSAFSRVYTPIRVNTHISRRHTTPRATRSR